MSPAPLSLLVLGYVFTVRRHALCDTELGLAGYFEATMPDPLGSLCVVGRWDRSDLPDHDTPWCAEHIWLNGDLIDFTEEGSHFLLLEGDSGGVTVEDIATELHHAIVGAAS